MKTLNRLLISIGFAVSLSALAGINDGLVAYYPFDGNADDASGNGWRAVNHDRGMVRYSPPPLPGWPTSGKRGGAAWFDGNSCLLMPQPRLLDGASNATITAWIWFDGAGGQLLGAGDGRGGRDPITTRIVPEMAGAVAFTQVIHDEETLIGFAGGGEHVPTLSFRSWHMFTMVLESITNGCSFRAYIDGELVKQTTNPYFYRIAYDADMSALIGALQASSPQQFCTGGIDELRIYNRALHRSDILELFYDSAEPNLTVEVSHVRVCLGAPTNKVCQLQYCSPLTTNMWVDWGAPFPGTGGRICVTDEVDGPSKLYRVIYLP
jgi:hypothetical protein